MMNMYTTHGVAMHSACISANLSQHSNDEALAVPSPKIQLETLVIPSSTTQALEVLSNPTTLQLHSAHAAKECKPW